MTTSTVTIKEGGTSLQGLRPASLLRARASRRRRADRLARRLISFGGMAIIACILAILLVILYQVFPLFRAAAAEPRTAPAVRLDGLPRLFLADEYGEVAGIVTTSGIRFVSLSDGAVRSDWAWPLDPPAALAAVSPPLGNAFAALFADGRLLRVRLAFRVTYPDTGRHVEPVVEADEPVPAGPAAGSARVLCLADTPEGPRMAVVTGPREAVILAVRETRALIGPAQREIVRRTVAFDRVGAITALAMDNRGEELVAGTSDGRLVLVEIRPDGARVAETIDAATRPGAALTALEFLLGGRTLAAGDVAGGIRTWQILRGDDGVRRLSMLHDFEAHPGPVSIVEPSARGKGFLTADAGGTLRFQHATSARTVVAVRAPGGRLCSARLGPKGDAMFALDETGRIFAWTLDAPHPEVTLRTLFGRVRYEGYAHPSYVWQSSGATDEVEPKLSLMPLIYGTLKGTIYALLLAVPLAVLGALYTAQFMHPQYRTTIKPVVELMAGIPSVVLGMLGGLWLAPRVERVVPGLFLMIVVIPAAILAALGLWRLVPIRVRGRLRPGTEVALLMPVVLAGAAVALVLGEGVEALLPPSGDFRDWVREVVGLAFDQRNSLVVGIAMGFAVIPIIFTIAEDAISNVPPHLTAGSLALGATPWQTAVRVVFPAASPAIFSAIMIGFGRAVGETMIMVMATGNTPIMDPSPFNGFRALSANIAVELPEAPQGGTLFRILFLSALLLFFMTFLVNTLAEVVRLRLRRRYSLL